MCYSEVVSGTRCALAGVRLVVAMVNLSRASAPIIRDMWRRAGLVIARDMYAHVGGRFGKERMRRVEGSGRRIEGAERQ